jgi:hypothetical protein
VQNLILFGWEMTGFLCRARTAITGLYLRISIPFEWTGYIMDTPAMTLNRFIFTDNSTIGDLSLDGIHQCWSLELSARVKEGRKVCIPAGRYEILIQWSSRFNMNTPHLLNVPGRTFIEIHPGNKPSDTEGCILLGQTKDVDWVGSSRAAYKELLPKLEDKLTKGKLYIGITGNA